MICCAWFKLFLQMALNLKVMLWSNFDENDHRSDIWQHIQFIVWIFCVGRSLDFKGGSKQNILCLGFGCDWKFSSYLEPSFNSMWFFPRIHRVPFLYDFVRWSVMVTRCVEEGLFWICQFVFLQYGFFSFLVELKYTYNVDGRAWIHRLQETKFKSWTSSINSRGKRKAESMISCKNI